jgi:hypothetical protein
MTLEEDNAQLRQANAALQAEVTRLQGVVTALEAQLAELRHPKSPPPPSQTQCARHSPAPTQKTRPRV